MQRHKINHQIEMLTDAYSDSICPLLADQSVSAIGARWGFPDAAHFSRTFKSAFGFSPSECRAGR